MGHVEDRWFVVRDGVKVQSARHGKGRRYRVRYVIDGRERSAGSFDRKADADRALVKVQADLLRGAWVDPTDTTPVVKACRAYAAARPHRASTAARMESLISVHVEGTPLGTRRLAAVVRGDPRRRLAADPQHGHGRRQPQPAHPLPVLL